MKELTRTLAFVAVAAVAVIVAGAVHKASQPKAIEGFEQVNTPFYPEFSDPTSPQGMRVVVVDPDTASVKKFEVALNDGRWVIPSHHSYPADAKNRLARTAASVIGIKRAALASRLESDFGRFNVIDPLGDDRTVLKGHGQRVTLTGENGKVLADYIIGKKVDKEEGMYYVRTPGDKSTYRANIEINLSTKFGDWIESDLLKLDADKLVEIVVEKYSIDRTKMRIVDPERNVLTRKSSTDPWTLDSLNAETEEVNTDEVRNLVNSLDDLKIVGVRPKPQGLKPDLSIDPKINKNPILSAQLMNSILSTGLLPGEDMEGNPKLISTEGEVLAGTNDGVEYVLQFGDVFTGSEAEVEVGFAKDSSGDKADAKSGEAESKSEGEAKADDKKPADENKPEDKKDEKPGDAGKDKKKDELKKSRYLMVYARFDEQRLGPAPVKPEKPAKPETEPEKKPEPEKKSEPEKKEDGDKKPDAEKKSETDKKPEGEKKADDEKKPEEKKSEEKKDEPKADSSDDEDEEEEAKPDEKKPEDKKPEEKKPDEKPADEKKPDDAKPDDKKPVETKPEEKKPTYEELLAVYNRELEKYENDTKLHDDKVEAGRKKVDQLNKRFGPWYYVISAESFDSLRLSRKTLVKEKAAKPEKSDEANPLNLDPLDLKPPVKPEPKDDGAKPDSEKPTKSEAPAEAESPKE